MPRRTLVVALVLTSLVGCRDGPQAITAPADPSVILEQQEMASTAALHAVWDILDDSFVRELVEDSGLNERKFHQTAMDMTAVNLREDLRELSTAVRFIDSPITESDADNEILRAVLELILDDAASVAASHFEDESSSAFYAGRR